MSSSDSQCGTVIDVNIECAVKLVGTNCILYPVNSKDLQHIWPFMYGDYIAYDCWLGKVYDLKNQVILKLSNGARCSMSTEDGSKLYDVCPHVSDSGLFFDDSYGFYPGQVLIGPSKVFSSVQWLSGVKPVLSTKSKFRVVVEEVQVVELKVTWITKSFCPGGTDSVSPPPSVISQENLSRVKRLGCFDHAQRQLGERCLYVFPDKVEPAKITCECPERNCVLGEGSVAKKVRRLLKKQIVKIMSCSPESQATSEAPDKESAAAADQKSEELKPRPTCELEDSSTNAPSVGEKKEEQPEETGKDKGGAAVRQQQPPFLLKDEGSSDYRLQSMEQDADDEAADDTDDTSSVTSSASSTASSQSGSGTGRKKSIPLSIKNLKRKHKKKKTKISREFKPGDRVAVEVVTTMTSADVMWQDGTVETNIRSNELIPVHHLDNNEFCPGDFVVDKRAQSSQDPGVYGVVQSGDHIGRTCMVKWFKLKATGDDVELIGEEEDVSVYDIADHPDFRFRTTDIVIRIGNSEGATAKEDELAEEIVVLPLSARINSKTLCVGFFSPPMRSQDSCYFCCSWLSGQIASMRTLLRRIQPSVGQVARVDVSSKVEVVWADNSKTIILPQHLYNIESEIEESDYDSVDGSTSGASSEWEDESDSWETDNGLMEDDHPKIEDLEPEEPAAEEVKKVEEQVQGAVAMAVADLAAEKAEEEKMEAMVETEKKEEKAEAQTPVRSEWPSETPVLCQQSGGKPGVTFTSAKGEVFSVLEYAPDTHAFKKMEFQPPEAKKFFSTVRKEMALLATSLPDGIMVKTFEDRMDLFSALIKGPTRTPYEDGLFLFDIQLPNIYPAVPPLFRYLSQCSGRLNPNLYDNGKVCVSLLGTWIGKGTERWTSKSSLLQVLISIQGLILVNEPYYNEAGFDSDRGLQEGYENSRCYNEMTLIRVVQSMMQLLRRPVEVFEHEIREHFRCNGWRLVSRIESWLETNELVERSHEQANGADSTSLLSACGTLSESPGDNAELLGEYGSSSEQGAAAEFSDSALDGKEELDESEFTTSTPNAGDLHQYSDSESTGQAREVDLARDRTDEGKAAQDSALQPSVKPKKRRKSYRSFLPEKSGYPDIGFPLFPLSKGFIKSIRGVLQQYRAALAGANIPEWTEDK
uniref:(E3-independent) E2 ubiquitin-conjugating enzyme n=1 Tax=Apteryx owenii TaxID=8824 RepID=A0A8B9PVC4_APTOW